MIERGKKYLIHTHLGIWLGEVVDVDHSEVKLNTCSWVHRQGRMGASVRNGTALNTEYVGDGVIVPRAIAVPWHHDLPTTDDGIKP